MSESETFPEYKMVKVTRFLDTLVYVKSSPIIQKTGPEAGQYFHVRPPIGFI